MHEVTDSVDCKEVQNRKKKLISARSCGSSHDTDLLLLAVDASPIITGNQKLILEGAALDVINEKETGADKVTTHRTVWPKLDI